MLNIDYFQTAKKTFAILVTLLILNLLINDTTIKHLLVNINTDIHSSFTDFLSKNFPSTQAIFLASILVGSSDQNISKELYSLFKRFNLVHVISISGSNFALIQSILENLKILMNKRGVILVLIFLQSLYYLIIGFNNAPALRAFIFALISNYSSLIGRPIKFYKKILFTVLIILAIRPHLIPTLSFILSTSFAIFYHLLGHAPLNKIFNNEVKRIALIFILSSLIFNSQAPDFLANLLFGLVYPFIFISIFIAYFLAIISIEISFLISFNSLTSSFIFTYFNELSSEKLSLIQVFGFLAILTITVKSLFNRTPYEVSKFN